MPAADMSPFALSLLVAGSATAVALPVGIGAAWKLSGVSARRRRFSVFGVLAETALTLPLVLPPTVIGYGLLLVLGRGTTFGAFLNDRLGIRLLFTWQGATIAAAVMALPLIFRTAETTFRGVDRELLEAGRTLGATEARLFWSVLLPLTYRGLLAAILLGFARALGEFGATLMIAGSIPGRTETLPLALYSAVLNGQDADARNYALVLATIAVVGIGAISYWGRRIDLGRGEP